MKKILLGAGVALLVGITAYKAYQVFLPEMIAQSIVEEPSPLVPDNIKDRLQKIRKPINDGADVVIETVHRSGVTLDDILQAIDEAREEQAFALLEELNNTEIDGPDQVFDMVKKHFPVRFDVEVFRAPFNKKVSLPMIKKAIRYANTYRKKEEFDPTTAKAIIKRVLLQKEEQFKKLTKID